MLHSIRNKRLGSVTVSGQRCRSHSTNWRYFSLLRLRFVVRLQEALGGDKTRLALPVEPAALPDVPVSDLERIVCAEVDWNESEPDDARGVHGEADVFRLVEVLGNLACLHRVHGAHDDQEHVVDERQQEPLVLRRCNDSHWILMSPSGVSVRNCSLSDWSLVLRRLSSASPDLREVFWCVDKNCSQFTRQ